VEFPDGLDGTTRDWPLVPPPRAGNGVRRPGGEAEVPGTPWAQPPQRPNPPAPTPPPPAPPTPPTAGPPPLPPPPPIETVPDQPWTPDPNVPTADDFAQRRAARPAEPVAASGVRAAVNRSTFGIMKLAPGRFEREQRHDIEMVRRNFGGLRQVTVVNPKGGAGKTIAILLLAMTFGQKRGGYVLAWDNNETQGTLGMRAQQDFHSRTVRDLLRDLDHFRGAHGRVGDLSQYVRAQGEGMFDVLASDESATAGEMLTAAAFADLREVVSRFYKLIFVDTGNNVRAQNWQAAIDATDQLVVTMSARNDSAETAARMLDHLEQTGRHRLVRQAVTVVSMPPSRRDIDLPAIEAHFAARTRSVLLAPYERFIDSGEPMRYGQLTTASRAAWLKIAAAVAEGL
jgi:MinD-like ATPase involved in chromosome partitioning or flagellar assembly